MSREVRLNPSVWPTSPSSSLLNKTSQLDGQYTWMAHHTKLHVEQGLYSTGPSNLLLEQALQFGFKATNNQAEYETILAGLNLTYDMGLRGNLQKRLPG